MFLRKLLDVIYYLEWFVCSIYEATSLHFPFSTRAVEIWFPLGKLNLERRYHNLKLHGSHLIAILCISVSPISFQFETEMEGSKLRRDVLAEGSVSSGGAPTGIISMLSGQEEMFAFRRAVSVL